MRIYRCTHTPCVVALPGKPPRSRPTPAAATFFSDPGLIGIRRTLYANLRRHNLLVPLLLQATPAIPPALHAQYVAVDFTTRFFGKMAGLAIDPCLIVTPGTETIRQGDMVIYSKPSVLFNLTQIPTCGPLRNRPTFDAIWEGFSHEDMARIACSCGLAFAREKSLTHSAKPPFPQIETDRQMLKDALALALTNGNARLQTNPKTGGFFLWPL